MTGRVASESVADNGLFLFWFRKQRRENRVPGTSAWKSLFPSPPATCPREKEENGNAFVRDQKTLTLSASLSLLDLVEFAHQVMSGVSVWGRLGVEELVNSFGPLRFFY